MKILCFAMACAACAAAMAQSTTTLSTTAGQFTIAAGSYTTASNSTLGGLTDYSPVGATDYSFRQAWTYRQAGDFREYNVASPGAVFGNTADTWDARLFKGAANSNTATPTLRFDVRYELTSPTPATPLLHANLCATNLTNSPLQVSVFYYVDLDVPNGFSSTSNDDVLTTIGNGFHLRQSDSVNPAYYADAYATGAVAFQHGSLFESQFTNNSLDNLNNSISSSFGDLAIAFQWDCLVPPGECCPADAYVGIGLTTPEPTGFLTLAIPLALIARKRLRGRNIGRKGLKTRIEK